MSGVELRPEVSPSVGSEEPAGEGLRWGAGRGGLSEEGLPGPHPVGVTLTALSEEGGTG